MRITSRSKCTIFNFKKYSVLITELQSSRLDDPSEFNYKWEVPVTYFSSNDSTVVQTWLHVDQPDIRVLVVFKQAICSHQDCFYFLFYPLGLFQTMQNGWNLMLANTGIIGSIIHLKIGKPCRMFCKKVLKLFQFLTGQVSSTMPLLWPKEEDCHFQWLCKWLNTW